MDKQYLIDFGDTKIEVFVYGKMPGYAGEGLYRPFPHSLQVYADITKHIPYTMGTIHLCEPLGAGYVTHEFAHALFHYMDIVDEDEEHYCDAIGKAIAEFWSMYYEEE